MKNRNIAVPFGRSFLTTNTFVQRAYAALDTMDDDDYRLRRLEGAKELIEEVIPIATFLKYFENAERLIRCRHFIGNQNFDARIRLSGREVDLGFVESEYYVEVTTVGSPNGYLQREALSRYGGVFGGEDIRREGSRRKGTDRIVSTPTVREGHQSAKVAPAIKWARDALKKKSAKDYPRPCILLLDVHPEGRVTIQGWAELAAAVRDNVDRERFARTFVVNSPASNIVFEI